MTAAGDTPARRTRASAAKKAPAKPSASKSKAEAKTTAAAKPAASTSKSEAAKKPTATKPAARKPATKTTATKKPTPTKAATAKKPTATKSAAKKPAARKPAPRKARATSTRPAGTQHEWDGTVTSVTELARHLHALRVEPDGRPVPSASVLNLVAVADDESAHEVESIIESMSDHQPSRALIVKTVGGKGGIDAHLETRATVFRGRASVQVELIRLMLHTDQPEGVASAIIPLLRSDLPVYLWWPGVPMPDDLLYREIEDTVDRVVTEAEREPDAMVALAQLAEVVSAGRVSVTDLAWARLTTWRQLITQLIDRHHADRMRRGSVLQIWYAGAQPTPDALLFAGWFREAIGDKLMVELHPRADVDITGLVEVHVDAGGPQHLSIERIPERESAAVVVYTAGRPTRRRVLPLPSRSRSELLAGELEMLRPDVPFERALPRALEVGAA